MRHGSVLVALVALVAAGCNSLLGIQDLTLDVDGAVDAPAYCHGDFVTACLSAAPAGAVTLTEMVDTDSDPRCQAITQPDGSTLCAIAGDTVTVDPAGAVVVGSRPLMLIATTAISIAGPLDASSTRAGQRGAGTEPAACGAPPAGTVSAMRGGGGAGGSLGAAGGAGGHASDTTTTGGVPVPAQPAAVLRGGCAGGAGGGATGGAGGGGGGAIALVSPTIDISQPLRASGAGGDGATMIGAGGGGGGSGGMLVLEATTITLTGAGEVVANGGGGGEGSGAGAGNPGSDAGTYNAVPLGGFNGAGAGGDGGDGGLATGAAQPGDAGAAGLALGGGGGGGGVGILRMTGTISGSQYSPPLTN